MKVEMTQGGKYRLRARFLITRLDADKLDILFPVPLARLKQSLSFHLGEKRLAYQVLADGMTARLAVNPKMYSGPTLLDVRFDVEPEESSLLRFGQVLLRAPQIQGDVHVGRIRWQIVPLSGPVPLVLGGQAHAAQRWKWQGWLFTPESQVSGDDLESWITQQPAGAGPDSAGIVFWATETDAVRVVLVPRQFWLLLCSAAFLLLGLGISFLPTRRFWGWLLVAALGACVLVVGMLWPGLLAPLLYGVQPGVVVLGLILLLQWLMHQRYRRQMLFMPGFARMRKGSSISRRSPAAERQTSTIDAGPQVGSSRIGP
jgi:hypothetical protein